MRYFSYALSATDKDGNIMLNSGFISGETKEECEAKVKIALDELYPMGASNWTRKAHTLCELPIATITMHDSLQPGVACKTENGKWVR